MIPAGFEVIDPCRVIVGAISFAAQRRISYKEWLSALPEDRVVIPSVDPIERTDTSVYERLVESTDPAHHDVSFMLYCLCEQVNQSLKGDTAEVPAARQKPSAEQMKDLAEKELAMIEKLLDNTCDGLLLGQDAAKKSEAAGLHFLATRFLGTPRFMFDLVSPVISFKFDPLAVILRSST